MKLSHDPNNTKWTRDTGGFGHKIMTAQGWQPGDILGAKNAAHAEFHTAANASHIRVFVKDDNLGLGATRGSGLAEGECTGLDVFQSLLGRLNGKDEDELIKEQNSREDLKRAVYTERRWGSVRFVKGGFLIGDKIQELIDNEEVRIRQLTRSSLSAVAVPLESDSSQKSNTSTDKGLVVKANMSKKKHRKLGKEQDEPAETDIKKSNKSDQSTTAQEIREDTLSTQPKKSKKKRKQLEEAGEESDASFNDQQDVSRRSKKKKKKRQQEGTKFKEVVEGGVATANSTSMSTSGSSTPQSLLSGRHAVRSRNIAQKRLAVLDTASLNQVSEKTPPFIKLRILMAF